ncbi:MAG: hypothetical protein JO086_15015 [Acidimicrobiia bacterium]|nr:hypothetical protein [Acidimicrobiia bacterium]
MENTLPLLAQLPGRYGFALFLRRAGLVDEDVALRLEMDLVGAQVLLRIAEAKLAAIESKGDAK